MQKIFGNLVVALVFLFVSVAAFAAPVDINTASAEQIAEAMVGVGESKAEAIVTFRKQHGAFKTVDDLVMVKGIGEKTLEKNRANIMVKAGAVK
ncbi:MAG: helix-hairpin-helix domain-containing protein [Gammaproteobacteria bacterium]|nr:helix-hairpin-helix domain-containing protein [Gammaproteobacteria bacterium]